MSDVLFLGKDDIRSQNRELAFKMVFREIKRACELDSMRYSQSGGVGTILSLREIILGIIKRYNISEQEIGTTLSLAIEFPSDVSRNQWFVGTDGKPQARFIDAKKDVLVKKVKSKKKSRGKK